ncbi:DUF3019 domain-containing protein [Thalassotalea euphylliae]|uniref:DUF3019 domain-containing protein n=1 Tax=Thalassotalea euphylliae TaxID=1655234 RepID=A0A3E0TNE7_9GAMM|nr:DUF3019 domain-containing protein [Thalassotalea euphylliae]REL25780.1 DUF3019 domain-containing protein [Thalassotalea euphylliae]
MDFLNVMPSKRLLTLAGGGLLMAASVMVSRPALSQTVASQAAHQESSELSSTGQVGQLLEPEQQSQPDAGKSPMLIASPNICELSEGTYLCEMKAALIWEMPQTGHYCLYEQDELQPLKCWPSHWSGSHVMTFQSDKPVTYVLRAYQSANLLGDVIVQANINVIGTLEQRIRAKRRRRFLRIF